MSIARQLAERITATNFADLPSQAIYWSKIALLDTIGVALGGSLEEPPTILREALDVEHGLGPCLIWGTTGRVSLLDAALINGTAAHTLDFDNTHNTSGGHISAAMFPALIAAAEVHGGTGADLLLAHTIGFEVGARLGRGLNPHHQAKGWHPTSTFGVFSVAAACARLLRLSLEQTEHALAMCASLASGVRANYGTMTKPLHVGECARRGLQAALIARRGFTANTGALEHKYGFFNVYNEAGTYNPQKILEHWADPWDIVKPGAAYKQYACCGGTHPVIDVCQMLVQEHGCFKADEISRVEARLPQQRLVSIDRPDPHTTYDAKFSLHYCVARALTEGTVLSSHFENDAHLDPVIRSILPCVSAYAFEPGEFPEGVPYGARVKVTLASGKVFSAQIGKARGRTADNPISLEQLKTKFRDCSRRVLSTVVAEETLATIERFENVRSMTELTRWLRCAVSPS